MMLMAMAYSLFPLKIPINTGKIIARKINITPKKFIFGKNPLFSSVFQKKHHSQFLPLYLKGFLRFSKRESCALLRSSVPCSVSLMQDALTLPLCLSSLLFLSLPLQIPQIIFHNPQLQLFLLYGKTYPCP